MTFLTRCLRQPRKVLIRKIAFQIHLWIGLAIGLYVVVLSLTGSALVFRREMDRAFAPDRPVRDPARQVMSVEELTEAARRAYPDYTIADGRPDPAPHARHPDRLHDADGRDDRARVQRLHRRGPRRPVSRLIRVAALGRQPARRPADHPRPERTVLERHRQHARDAAVHHRRDRLVARHRVVAPRDVGQAARRRGSASTSTSTARSASGSSRSSSSGRCRASTWRCRRPSWTVVNLFFGPQPDAVAERAGRGHRRWSGWCACTSAAGAATRSRWSGSIIGLLPAVMFVTGLRHVVEPRRQEAADGARAPAAAGARTLQQEPQGVE